MRFSLVMGTHGRYAELERFLISLARQSYRDFELVVVDQNEDHLLEELVASYSSSINIKHVRCERRGLSQARNAGLEVAVGDVFAFPDDDCEYPEDLLERVARVFDENPEVSGITGVARDKATGKAVAGRFDKHSGQVTFANVWQRHVSISIFLKRSVVESVGAFDESLGVGARFGSGEETDLILRAIHKGFKIMYRPDIEVYHPDPVGSFDKASESRAYSYGLGTGAVLRKHISRYGLYRLIPEAARSLIRPALACLAFRLVNRAKSRYYLASCKGRMTGFLRYRAEKTSTAEAVCRASSEATERR